MGGGTLKSNPIKARKRVEATDESGSGTCLVRGKGGSAFARCEECNKDVPVALISFHSCSLDAKIKMNLESQVVEKLAEAKKPSERKKSTSKEPTAKRAKKEKAKISRNSNKPKRPTTAFFLFMDDFRKEFKEANPNSKDVKTVAKEGGAKWKSLTDEEKKQYTDKAAELKAEYVKARESDKAEDRDVEEGSEKEAEDNKEVEGEDNNEGEDVSDEE